MESKGRRARQGLPGRRETGANAERRASRAYKAHRGHKARRE